MEIDFTGITKEPSFSHRLTRITRISSIYSFPCSPILHVMINYRRSGYYYKFGGSRNKKYCKDIIDEVIINNMSRTAQETREI